MEVALAEVDLAEADFVEAGFLVLAERLAVLVLLALAALTIAFMFDYVSEDDCNEYKLQSSCTAFSDKCEW